MKQWMRMLIISNTIVSLTSGLLGWYNGGVLLSLDNVEPPPTEEMERGFYLGYYYILYLIELLVIYIMLSIIERLLSINKSE
jgi:hypothetical protein